MSKIIKIFKKYFCWKKILKIIFWLMLASIIFLILAMFIYHIFFFNNKNYKKCLNLKIGMSEKEVINIMGTPLRIIIEESEKLKNYKILEYPNPSIMAGWNFIYIDTETLKVITIHCSDENIK